MLGMPASNSIAMPSGRRSQTGESSVRNNAIPKLTGIAISKAITDVTRVAANTLSNYSRIKSTEIHDKALEIMLRRKDIGVKALTAGEGT